MSITVVRRPIVSSGGHEFKFNSVGLPTIYELSRRDFTFNQVNNNGGFAQLQFNSTNVSASFSVGDIVYVKSTNNSNYALASVVSASAFSGGNTLVTLQASYVASSQGYVNNDTLRSGYYVQVRFYDTNDELLTDAILEISPDAQGTMVIDISEFVKSFLSPDFENIAPAFAITEDTLAAKEMYIGYREVWFGSQENETADDSNTIVAVLGAQQLPLSNGSNYGVSAQRFVSVQDSSNAVNARFLTDKTRLKVWRGWPFTISILFNNFGGDDVQCDVSGNSSGELETLPAYNMTTQNQMLRINIGLIDWSLYQNDSSIEIDFNGPDISVDINADLIDACDGAVMLCFRNHLGGDSWFMFDGSQDISYTDDNGSKVKRLLLTAENITEEDWEELNDLITYGAEVKENIVEILSTTNKTKRRVNQQVYKVDQDGTKTGVIIIPRQTGTISRQVKHRFEVEVEFPEHFLP